MGAGALMEKTQILFLVLLFVTTWSAAIAAGSHHKLLLISFDGLRWDYPDRRPDLQNFNYLKENGVRAEYMAPPFPSQTSPSHTTIVTGLYTESHGVVHNVNYNRSESDVVVGSFYTTLAVNDWWDNGYEPIWITASSQGLKSGGYLYPGSNATIGGKAATRSILETFATPKEEEDWRFRIDDVMSWFRNDNFDFIALYFEEPDSTGHNFGPDAEEITNDALPLVDRTIGYLLDKVKESGLEEDLNIIIVSDHGMTAINKTVRGDEVISTLSYVNASDIFFQFPYAALGLVEPYPDKMEKVYNQLKDANKPMKVYYKKDIPERFHYANNDRVTSIVLIADLGYTIYRDFPGVHINSGDHGYDNMEPDMRSSYYAIGPSFKKNFTQPGFESIHVYELMCHLLDLTPAPNNGSLDVLSIALKGNSTRTISSAILLVFQLIAAYLVSDVV